MANFKDYDELTRAVDKNGAVLTCEMWQLRVAHKAGKLGVHVVANISDELDKRGFGHYPAPLPQNQYEKARIYRRSGAIGSLIKAVLSVDKDADEVLKSIGTDDAAETIKKIRELVCD